MTSLSSEAATPADRLRVDERARLCGRTGFVGRALPIRRALSLLGEGVRVAMSQPVSSGTAAAISTTVCVVIIATTGQTALNERQVLSRVDDAGTRSITVTDTNGRAGLTAAVVDRIARLRAVQGVIGLTAARDGRNASLQGAGTPVPVRQFHGELPPGAPSTGPPLRPPLAGEALAGRAAVRALGFSQPVGTVAVGSGEEVAVVGIYGADGPLAFLDNSVLVRAALDPTAPVRSIHVLTHRPDDVAAVTDAVSALLGPTDRGAIRLETSETLAKIRAAVAGDLGRFGRRIVAIALGVGLVLIALNVYGSVVARRRDFGRRRVLGATRLTIITVVVIQTLLPAVVGTVLGSGLGTGLVLRWAGAAPPPRFILGTALLTCLISGVASVPPAIVAAFRDPIRVLRVP